MNINRQQLVTMVHTRLNELYKKLEFEKDNKRIADLVKLIKINEVYFEEVAGKKYRR